VAALARPPPPRLGPARRPSDRGAAADVRAVPDLAGPAAPGCTRDASVAAERAGTYLTGVHVTVLAPARPAAGAATTTTTSTRADVALPGVVYRCCVAAVSSCWPPAPAGSVKQPRSTTWARASWRTGSPPRTARSSRPRPRCRHVFWGRGQCPVGACPSHRIISPCCSCTSTCCRGLLVSSPSCTSSEVSVPLPVSL